MLPVSSGWGLELLPVGVGGRDNQGMGTRSGTGSQTPPPVSKPLRPHPSQECKTMSGRQAGRPRPSLRQRAAEQLPLMLSPDKSWVTHGASKWVTSSQARPGPPAGFLAPQSRPALLCKHGHL